PLSLDHRRALVSDCAQSPQRDPREMRLEDRPSTRNRRGVSMVRFRSSALAFGSGMALVIVVLVLGDLHQTLIAAVKATLVRDVDNAANYPYIGGFEVSGPYPTVPTTTLDGKPVKRAVIEYVAGTCASVLPATIFEVSF